MAAEELRRHNLASVLSRLHLAGSSSRSQLTSFTELNRSTIADLIGELSALGLVEERPGSSSSRPGRPSPIVATRPESVAVLAIEIAVDSIALATVGLGGHIYNKLRIARPRGRFSPEETVQEVAKLAGTLLDSLPTHRPYFVGVAAAVAGVVRRSDGLVRLSPNLGWRDVPFANMLAEVLGLGAPILVANEADMGALAEYRRGEHAGVQHLVYVSGEVGLGTGIIVNGKGLGGAAGYAGEVGHTLINPEGRACRCGAVGCWETEAGEAALLRRAGLQMTETGTEVLESIAQRALEDDRDVLAAIDGIGHWLGLGVGDLINTFNPEAVVMGGLYHRLYEFLESSLLDAVRSRALEAPLEIAVIGPSELGADSPLIGAAELALTGVLSDPASVSDVTTSQGIPSAH
ncbi:MAG: ROK family protein [Acidimicrobiia bacterium]